MTARARWAKPPEEGEGAGGPNRNTWTAANRFRHRPELLLTQYLKDAQDRFRVLNPAIIALVGLLARYSVTFRQS